MENDYITITIIPVMEPDADGNDILTYQYNIYDASAEDVANGDIASLDGGACTTSLANALDMATKQAHELIKNL